MHQTAKKAAGQFHLITRLKADIYEKELPKLGKKAGTAARALDIFFRTPQTTIANLAKNLETSAGTANALLTDLVNLGIMAEETGMKKNRIFTFKPFLEIFGAYNSQLKEPAPNVK